jgi:hypothetical protein
MEVDGGSSDMLRAGGGWSGGQGSVPSQLVTHRTHGIKGIMDVSFNDFLSLI